MIEAHSAFLSMSPVDAFCVFRILPRIGSSAWNSELRATLAVPSAESPSTMNSSERSSLLRQSTSLEGSEDDSSAVLRRWFSRCWRAATRAREALTTFSSTARACCLADAALGLEERAELGLDDLRDDLGDRRRAEHLLGLALELRLGQPHGDDRGQALEHVVLDDLLARLQQPGRGQGARDRPDSAALEAGDVGAALGRGDDVDVRAHGRVVAGRPSARPRRPRARGRRRSAPCARRRRASARSR